ncbi:MAG TPA: tetratricopeptide repeat protein [Candidatus Cybelea sp.]|jgi:predicted ATPase/DNA-binding XRE family transcriptional regulator
MNAATEPSSRSAFGALLREYRLAAGLSQAALAERALMSVDSVSALERGVNRAPHRETLALLIEALQLDADQRNAIEQVAEHPSRPRRSGRRPAPRSNLPAISTPLFGRTDELHEIADFVTRSRLVTLTGSGGVGKTRLALQVGVESLSHFPDGIWFVDLAPMRDPRLVTAAVAKIFSIKESEGKPLMARLAGALHGKRLLLIVDNCEHLLAPVAALVEALTASGGQLRMLATSRQPLRIDGEQTYRVASLPVPDESPDLTAARALHFGAIALFNDRARRAVATFEMTDANVSAVVRICRRLDGIALAIELAAARLVMLSPQQLEERLSERFRVLTSATQSALPRHRTMRALIDWSYDLLLDDEKTLFARLAVFAAPFSPEAASAICADGEIDRWRVFDLLASLVDKSLVGTEAYGKVKRCRLLESMRAYASERAGTELEPLRKKHAEYYVALAEAAQTNAATNASTYEWTAELELEFEDVRAALDWASGEHGDLELGARLLTAMLDFWLERGHAAEVARRAEALLDKAKALPKPLLAALWLTLASMLGDLHAPARGYEAAVRARELYAELGDKPGFARALRNEGVAQLRLGKSVEAEASLEHALALSREFGGRWGTHHALLSISLFFQMTGRWEKAQRVLLEVLDLAREAGDEPLISITLINLGECAFALGDVEAAIDRARKNLSSSAVARNVRLRAVQGSNLALYLLASGRTDDARKMAFAALRDARAAGDDAMVAVALQHWAAIIARQDPKRAVRVLGFAQSVFDRIGFKREQAELYSYDMLSSTLTEVLAPGELEVWAVEGASMTEERAVRLAQQK